MLATFVSQSPSVALAAPESEPSPFSKAMDIVSDAGGMAVDAVKTVAGGVASAAGAVGGAVSSLLTDGELNTVEEKLEDVKRDAEFEGQLETAQGVEKKPWEPGAARNYTEAFLLGEYTKALRRGGDFIPRQSYDDLIKELTTKFDVSPEDATKAVNATVSRFMLRVGPASDPLRYGYQPDMVLQAPEGRPFAPLSQYDYPDVETLDIDTRIAGIYKVSGWTTRVNSQFNSESRAIASFSRQMDHQTTISRIEQDTEELRAQAGQIRAARLAQEAEKDAIQTGAMSAQAGAQSSAQQAGQMQAAQVQSAQQNALRSRNLADMATNLNEVPPALRQFIG